MPRHLREAVSGLTPQQMEARYRPGGWTVRQVVHHLADSHMNAYVRSKLAITENEPTIKPYDPKAWADLADNRDVPVEVSLSLVEALHKRWDGFLRSLEPADFARRLQHPERGPMTLDDLVAPYAWHGRHHVAHITSLRLREGLDLTRRWLPPCAITGLQRRGISVAPVGQPVSPLATRNFFRWRHALARACAIFQSCLAGAREIYEISLMDRGAPPRAATGTTSPGDLIL